MELNGKVIHIADEEQVTTSFRKRNIVIRTDEQYPQEIQIEFTQDKCDLLSNYKINEIVKISINLGGRSWVNPQGETKWFNSIKGWRIERTGVAAPSAPAQTNTAQTQTNPQQAPSSNNEEEHDDLPF